MCDEKVVRNYYGLTWPTLIVGAILLWSVIGGCAWYVLKVIKLDE